MFRKEKSVVEDDPKKNWSGIDMKARVEYEEVGLEVSLMGIHQKGGLTFTRIERKTPALQSKQGLLRSRD